MLRSVRRRAATAHATHTNNSSTGKVLACASTSATTAAKIKSIVCGVKIKRARVAVSIDCLSLQPPTVRDAVKHVQHSMQQQRSAERNTGQRANYNSRRAHDIVTNVVVVVVIIDCLRHPDSARRPQRDMRRRTLKRETRM